VSGPVDIEISDEIVAAAALAYWRKFGEKETLDLNDDEVEQTVSMRAALEAVAPALMADAYAHACQDCEDEWMHVFVDRVEWPKNPYEAEGKS
jgi:hypothetical protein